MIMATTDKMRSCVQEKLTPDCKLCRDSGFFYMIHPETKDEKMVVCNMCTLGDELKKTSNLAHTADELRSRGFMSRRKFRRDNKQK